MPQIGKKLSPILNEIEKTLWENEYMFPDDMPEFTIEGFRGAVKIFTAVMLERAFKKDNKLNATKLGKELKDFIEKYTDIDTHDLYKKK